MKIEKYVVGMIGTNCYLVINEETKDTVMVDPGAYPAKLKNAVKEQGLKLKAVLLTHAHFDHIMGIEDFLKAFDVPVYVGREEQPLLADDRLNASSMYGYHCAYTGAKALEDGQTVECAGTEIHVIHTPGHTKGSCCYYLKDEGVLFSGDTVFYGSVGRTDFPGGSTAEIVRSLHKLVDSLPEETEVFPGHDASTTIGYEKRYNPFV